jgi:hypothetical protein
MKRSFQRARIKNLFGDEISFLEMKINLYGDE